MCYVCFVVCVCVLARFFIHLFVYLLQLHRLINNNRLRCTESSNRMCKNMLKSFHSIWYLFDVCSLFFSFTKMSDSFIKYMIFPTQKRTRTSNGWFMEYSTYRLLAISLSTIHDAYHLIGNLIFGFERFIFHFDVFLHDDVIKRLECFDESVHF